MKVVTLCHKKNRCCPQVFVGNDSITIKDDYNGLVQMTKEQFEILKEKIKNNEL